MERNAATGRASVVLVFPVLAVLTWIGGGLFGETAAQNRSAASQSEAVFVATLRPGKTALIKARQDEQVAEVPCKVRARVKAGDLLVRFVDNEERILVERAEAFVDQSRADNARLERLHADGQVSDELLEKSSTDLRVAEANLRLARVRLAELSVRAPFDGIVVERFVDPGTSVEPGDSLVRVSAVKKLRLEALLPQEILPRLSGVRELQVTIAGTEETFWVPFEAGPMTIDPASGTFLLQLEVDNRDERYLPGGRCTISLGDDSVRR